MNDAAKWSKFLHLLLVTVLSGIPTSASAAPIDADAIPSALKEWTGWVLHGEEQKTCPFIYNRFDDHRCAWPTELDLELGGDGGRFKQAWQVDIDSWITLPGDAKRWPLDVSIDGVPVVVVQRNNRPAVWVKPGAHAVAGAFRWNKLPESLPVPRETGLIALGVEGKAVDVPVVDDGGNLWLKDRDAAASRTAVADDRVNLKVFRRVVDEVPLLLVTHMELEVSGAQREELLTGALPAPLIPLALESRLPARLEPDGRLRVQVRPGRWVIRLTSRHPGETTVLALAESPAPWPKEEVWVFDARNALRLVEIGGPAGVDPRQTGLPEEWHNLPAFLMPPGAEMKFTVVRRGDPEPEPDNLSLQRNLWLDFSGDGYTMQDTISGTMTRGWRLEAMPQLQLGRVSLDGMPQFITSMEGSDRRGVEVRRGALNLSADSRWEEGIGDLPAIGWDQDFQSVATTLHLPPGWDLLSTSGVDNVPDTWIKRWTLLDIFLVLIAALAVRGLWGWKPGLLALVALVLVWHEPDAPRTIWLHVLAAIALLRVLPAGRFQWVARAYRNLALLALVVIAVPFMVNQVRTGLYPQLETWGYPGLTSPGGYLGGMEQYSGMDMAAQAPAAAPAPGAVADAPMRAMERASEMVRKSIPGEMEEIRVESRATNFMAVDPDSNVQTGPGLPNWQWRQIPLGWNGPVQKDQQISLLLLSPTMNLVLNLLRVLLVVALGVLVAGWHFTPGRGLHRAAGLIAAAGLLPLLMLQPREARADIPTPELLQELKTRLLAPPECLPECAQSPRLRFELTPQSLTVRVEVHASEEVAVPLPARGGAWAPDEVQVDGGRARALMRAKDGTLWVNLGPGAHQIVLRGRTAEANTFQLPLPLTPRYVEFTAEGWSVEGIADNVPVGAQLQFTRQKTEQATEKHSDLQPGELPPLVRVERTLNLGLDWRVHTSVHRASPSGTPIVLSVPLLPGESVTTDGVETRDGNVQVNLGARSVTFAWVSSLEVARTIKLTAPHTTNWTEVWRADVSPIWHMATSGIAVVHHVDTGGGWMPEWRPWPGESVELDITRPAGVAGRTLTIDQAEVRTTPGKRATDTAMNLTLRSSQGGQHTIALPDDVQLLSVTIDGAAQPIRQDGRNVTLPLKPGTQQAMLSLRSSSGLGMLFRTPEVDLAAPSVNTRLNVSLGQDRWVLLLGGPRLGPAVLFWGVLLVVVLIAVGLGRVDLTPLTTWHWILLGIGLTQTSIGQAAIIVGWLLALGARARIGGDMGRIRFNFLQFGLGFLTLLALITLFNAVKHGLLGLPEMQIAGNNSSAWDLNWYQDRSDAALPRAWLLSVPLWVYRGLMLAWALWLAFALLKWLRWGWDCFSAGGLWKAKPKIEKPAVSSS